MQDEMTRFSEAMAERDRRGTAPASVTIENLLLELAAARGRVAPPLDADARELLLARVADALAGRG